MPNVILSMTKKGQARGPAPYGIFFYDQWDYCDAVGTRPGMSLPIKMDDDVVFAIINNCFALLIL